jgi:hypothetical protein
VYKKTLIITPEGPKETAYQEFKVSGIWAQKGKRIALIEGEDMVEVGSELSDGSKVIDIKRNMVIIKRKDGRIEKLHYKN